MESRTIDAYQEAPTDATLTASMAGMIIGIGKTAEKPFF